MCIKKKTKELEVDQTGLRDTSPERHALPNLTVQPETGFIPSPISLPLGSRRCVFKTIWD